MKTILLLAAAVAGWLALNHYNHQPYFSNPFADRKANEKMLDQGKAGLEKSGDYLKEKGGEALDKAGELAVEGGEKLKQAGSEALKQGKQAAADTADKVGDYVDEKTSADGDKK